MKLVDEPDKGRAWLIAGASCIINMILSGISRMVGILFVAVIDDYGVTRQEATMPFSVRNSIRSLIGPLVGLVGLHFQVRNISFCGGVVATLGACLCSIAPNITWLTIFWGLIHGAGFAFSNTLFQVIVNQYFDKYRTTASGIALSGACLGSLAFPFMFEAIIEKYGLKGAFLITGGLIMNVLPFTILLVPPSWANKTEIHDAPDSHNETLEEEIEDDDDIDDEVIFEELRCHRINHSQSFSNCPTDPIQIGGVKKSASFYIRKKPAPDNFQVKEELKNEGNTNGLFISVENINSGNGFSEVDLSGTMSNSSPQHKKKEENKSDFVSSLKSIVNLYRNPLFLLISLCMVAYIMIFIPMLAVVVDYGKDKGLPESQGKYLISSMALGDLIGRLGFGWVTDRGLMTISNFMMTSLLLQGPAIMMFPFANSLYTISGLLILYGMTAGSTLVLFPVLVYKHVSAKDQPIAMGSAGFLSGMATFGIPPFIGYFRDQIGSYDGMFYTTAGISILSGLLWLFEPVIVKRRKKIEK